MWKITFRETLQSGLCSIVIMASYMLNRTLSLHTLIQSLSLMSVSFCYWIKQFYFCLFEVLFLCPFNKDSNCVAKHEKHCPSINVLWKCDLTELMGVQVYRHCSHIDITGLKDPRLHEQTVISALYNLGRLFDDDDRHQVAFLTYFSTTCLL